MTKAKDQSSAILTPVAALAGNWLALDPNFYPARQMMAESQIAMRQAPPAAPH